MSYFGDLGQTDRKLLENDERKICSFHVLHNRAIMTHEEVEVNVHT